MEAFLKLKLVGIITSNFATFIEKATACNLGISPLRLFLFVSDENNFMYFLIQIMPYLVMSWTMLSSMMNLGVS